MDHADIDQNTGTAGNGRCLQYCWTQVRCRPQPFHYACTQRETSESEGMKYSVGLCHAKPRSPLTLLCCFFTSENTAAAICSVRMYVQNQESQPTAALFSWSPYPWIWGHYGGCLSKKTSLTQTGRGETTSASLRQSWKLKGRVDIPVAPVFNLFGSWRRQILESHFLAKPSCDESAFTHSLLDQVNLPWTILWLRLIRSIRLSPSLWIESPQQWRFYCLAQKHISPAVL